MRRWVLYTATLGFAVYWASNLLLWFPWSHSAALGMTLMLTVAPVLWGYVALLCLRTYPGQRPARAASSVALVLLFLSVTMDYVFFGLIRNAMQQLYHPTTFYAYGFLVCLPFIVGWVFRTKIQRDRREPTRSGLVVAGICGLLCCGILTLIIVLAIGT